ncbi:LacI family DNA-binding transcriptional regulator [Silvimonas sp. JCM 19000]
MTTLSEVAQHAGVTPATVSNVLRNRGRVSNETRQRVLDAIDALGYRPNLNARALAEGRGPTLALMVSSIANPFYPEFALAAERAARAHGSFMLLCNTNDDTATAHAYLNQLAGSLSQGVLVMNGNLDFAVLRQSRSPVVLCMWEKPHESPGLPCVAVDFYLAGQLAAQHLLALQHRDIGIVVGNGKGGIHASRLRGFTDAMAAAGVHFAPELIETSPDTVQGGYAAGALLLQKHPHLTAIFATNDLPAIGAMHAATDLGLRIPADLSVMGITDIQMAQESRPALSTVAVPTQEAAELAVSLLRKLVGPDARAAHAEPQMLVTSQPVLVPRASTASPRARRG